ncbi:MAG: FAD binding domain-containing protein [Planctomycetota bacterium]
MYVPTVEWHEAESLSAATELMHRFGASARFLAGGTDVLVDLKSGRNAALHLISLNRIPHLRGISSDAAGMRIGALTTPNELLDSELVRKDFSPLLDAVSEMAAPQVRNMATVGGNIASAIPSADLPPILTVMNAQVVLWSPRGERVISLEEFFVGPRRSLKAADEILTYVLVPNMRKNFGAAYARFALRSANACAVAGVAAGLRLSPAGLVEDVKLTLCAVAPTPKPVPAVGEVLSGRRPDDATLQQAATAAMQASEPISDIRGSAEFRREIVAVLARRALDQAIVRAKGNAA